MIIQPTFWEALHLGDYSPPIISIVGAGGKTSLLYRLGEEAIATNRSALLSGTTLFTLPKKEIASQRNRQRQGMWCNWAIDYAPLMAFTSSATFCRLIQVPESSF